MAKKGDIVALRKVHVTYFTNPYRSERSEQWSLVECISATKDGIVKAYRYQPENFARKLTNELPGRCKIFTIDDAPQQTKARLLFDASGLNTWNDGESLKRDILAAKAA
jgi:hypothetical protein